MVRKITALLMVLSVAALCAAPSFAAGTRGYSTLYNHVFSYNNDTFESLSSANQIIFAANNNRLYSVGSSFKIFKDSSKTIPIKLEYPYTYSGTYSIRFDDSESLNSSFSTVNFTVLACSSNSFNGTVSYPFSWTTTDINNNHFLNIKSFSNVSYTVDYYTNSPYIIDIDFVFRIDSALDSNDYVFLCPILTLQSSIGAQWGCYFNRYSFSYTYDLTGDLYNQAVIDQMNSIEDRISSLDNSIDNGFSQNHQDNVAINNNLSAIDSSLDGIDQSVQGVGNKVDDMSQDIQDKMEDLQQQEKDEVEGSYDDSAAEDLEEQIDLSFTQSITQLFNSLSYSGTSFTFRLPATGTIPYLNSELWPTQNIPLKEYIDKMPSVLLVGIRLLLGLGFGLVIIAEIRSIIHMINGSKGD